MDGWAKLSSSNRTIYWANEVVGATDLDYVNPFMIIGLGMTIPVLSSSLGVNFILTFNNPSNKDFDEMNGLHIAC